MTADDPASDSNDKLSFFYFLRQCPMSRITPAIKSARHFPRNVPSRSTFHSGKPTFAFSLPHRFALRTRCDAPVCRKNKKILKYHRYTLFLYCLCTHTGQTRSRNNTGIDIPGGGTTPAESPYSGRTSFFSKISSRFSKRYVSKN